MNGYSSKKCSRCGTEKNLTDFYADLRARDGKQARCKTCCIEVTAAYALAHRDSINACGRIRYALDSSKNIAATSKWQANNRDRANATMARWRERTPNAEKKQQRIWAANNRERLNAAKREWEANNPEKKKLYSRRRIIKRRNSVMEKLHHNISSKVYRSLKDSKNGRKWESLVGYSVAQLKKHLEKQFDRWMTWDNYGEWHIDHKIPKSAFNFENPEDIDFKRCWALKNLQPLRARDNLQKNDRLEKPFQPSLAI